MGRRRRGEQENQRQSGRVTNPITIVDGRRRKLDQWESVMRTPPAPRPRGRGYAVSRMTTLNEDDGRDRRECARCSSVPNSPNSARGRFARRAEARPMEVERRAAAGLESRRIEDHRKRVHCTAVRSTKAPDNSFGSNYRTDREARTLMARSRRIHWLDMPVRCRRSRGCKCSLRARRRRLWRSG